MGNVVPLRQPEPEQPSDWQMLRLVGMSVRCARCEQPMGSVERDDRGGYRLRQALPPPEDPDAVGPDWPVVSTDWAQPVALHCPGCGWLQADLTIRALVRRARAGQPLTVR